MAFTFYQVWEIWNFIACFNHIVLLIGNIILTRKYVNQKGKQNKRNFLSFKKEYFNSKESATFFYDNRYKAFEECKNPCETMDLSISYQGSLETFQCLICLSIHSFTFSFQYKILNTKPYVRFDLPRQIEVTSESIKKSFSSVGKSHYAPKLFIN